MRGGCFSWKGKISNFLAGPDKAGKFQNSRQIWRFMKTVAPRCSLAIQLIPRFMLYPAIYDLRFTISLVSWIESILTIVKKFPPVHI